MSAVFPMTTVTSLDLPNEVAETRATTPQRRIEWMDTARGRLSCGTIEMDIRVGRHMLHWPHLAFPWRLDLLCPTLFILGIMLGSDVERWTPSLTSFVGTCIVEAPGGNTCRVSP